jgi:cobalt-zinc-cadmium efflux system outer membrane protein
MRDAVEVAVLTELTDAYEGLVSAYDEAIVLRDVMVPAAETTFEGTSDGFVRGRYGYLEVLDVQRTLFELKSQYVEALAAYHSARADVERLIGESLGTESRENQ